MKNIRYGRLFEDDDVGGGGGNGTGVDVDHTGILQHHLPHSWIGTWTFASRSFLEGCIGVTLIVQIMLLVVMMTTQAYSNTTPHIHGSGPGHSPPVVF